MAKPTKSHRRNSAGGIGRRNARRGGKAVSGGKRVLLYGRHAVLAAVANPRREITRVLAIPQMIERWGEMLGDNPRPEQVDRDMLDGLLGPDAVHQGIAAYARPLIPLAIEELIEEIDPQQRSVILLLDEVTDPRNVGAILRSAAAFGASGMVVTRHNAATETGALAKAASGALDQVPIVEAGNLRRAIEFLKEAGFWCLGLDHPASGVVGRTDIPERTAWILGAEGKGLRRLTAETCDGLLSIPITETMESLNVSTAAAIALYEWARQHQDLSAESDAAWLDC